MRDLVNFLSPQLEMCDTFACYECAQPGTGKRRTTTIILRKFINPLLINHGRMMRDLQPARNQSTKYQTFT